MILTPEPTDAELAALAVSIDDQMYCGDDVLVLIREVQRLRAELHVRTYDYGYPSRPPDHRDTSSYDEGFRDGWLGRKQKQPYQGSSTLAYEAGYAKARHESAKEIQLTLGMIRGIRS